MNIIEKIIAQHSKLDTVKPGDIVDIDIDVRAARDFGGANVVKNLEDRGLGIHDVSKTFFTFDCNPTGSDQKYAVNQHICRLYARKHGIRVYDIDKGIGTHILIHEGLAYSGSTAVTTDSHANILGAVGAFGQGMGDVDIAAAWSNGKVWFKVPPSVKIQLHDKRPQGLSAKDIVLNLLSVFGANTLLGYSVEIYGDAVDAFTLDERITIASMATEMGAIIILFTPNQKILDYSSQRAGKKIDLVAADPDATYEKSYDLDLASFVHRVSVPGAPHDTISIESLQQVKIDSAFIGSCTNGRLEDMKAAADILKDKKVAPGVLLKIVPATEEVWNEALEMGYIHIFRKAGALISNPGCAGCAAGQVGQNGEGEVSISTGNRNFPGKQGKGEVYLASPAVVAASSLAGYITHPERIPEKPMLFESPDKINKGQKKKVKAQIQENRSTLIRGKAWYIQHDNIDTDMIFHNRYLSITKIEEMGQYTFDNLKGYEDFAKKAKSGDIVFTQKNFGSGSSRQQAVDCFKSLGVQAIVAESFGAIYERNAINAAMPILTYSSIKDLELEEGDDLSVDFESGVIVNHSKNTMIQANPFSEVQMEIYQNGGLF
jgi:3-isopropylmalate/(R)-2-methylmalate dehydratase large subunit